MFTNSVMKLPYSMNAPKIDLLLATAGMSPSEYLRAVKVQRAYAMLLQGDSPAEVAVACGFADQSHFTHAFRNAIGYTPGRYRKAFGVRFLQDGNERND